PAIRFPFRLKDRQRGYPGFDLYCSDNNHTVLELPTSVKTFVNSIDYESQQINVTVSDGCFPRIIRGLHLPSSPFQFKTEKYYLDNYALFNCTPGTDKIFRPIHCLSSRCQLVYAFQSNLDIEDLPILSCTKMYSVSSVPSDIWNSPFLELTWSEPKCGPCEVKGEKCRLKWHPIDRPSVKSVVQMLEGKGDKLTIPPNPFASTSSRRVSENMPTKRLIQELEVIPESD
ncbi:ring-h2 finger protein atl22, partial [Quercus suber]